MSTITKLFAILFFLSAIVLGVTYLTQRDRIDFALLAPQEKFAKAWYQDTQLLEKSTRLPKQWQEIKEVEITSEPSPAREWLAKTKAPMTINPAGKYKLKVFGIHWIDDYRYGVTLEYWLVDEKTNNTVWESARTLKLGFVY